VIEILVFVVNRRTLVKTDDRSNGRQCLALLAETFPAGQVHGLLLSNPASRDGHSMHHVTNHSQFHLLELLPY